MTLGKRTKAYLVLLGLVGASLGWASPRTPPFQTLARGNWSDLRAWPDASGRRVLIAYREETCSLSVIDSTSNSRKPAPQSLREALGPDCSRVRDVQWSPRSDRIAIEVVSDDVAETYLWDSKSNSVEVLAFGPIASSNPQWDTSGKWLFFLPGVNDPENEDGLYAYEVSSGKFYKMLSGVVLSHFEIAGHRLIGLRWCSPAGNEVITSDVAALKRSAVKVTVPKEG